MTDLSTLRIETLEERIAPSALGNPSTGANPEVPRGAHPQPNPGAALAGSRNVSGSSVPEVPAGANPQPWGIGRH